MKFFLCSAVSLSFLALGAMAQDRTLTISVYSFGKDAMDKAVFSPFEKVCNCDVVIETGRSVERMAKIEANADDPVIDVAVMSAQDALSLARQELLSPMDFAKIPSHGDLYESAQDPLGNQTALGYGFYATSIVYRSDLVEIESWADLLSDELKGRVALPNITGTQGPLTLEMISKALGYEGADYAATIDAIGAQADQIVTFYNRSSELAQLMLQEEVIAAPVGRFAWSRFSGAELPFAWAEPAEGQTGGMNVIVMTKDNGNEDLSYQFIDYWLSKEVQTRVAEAGLDSPANSKVTVSDEAAASLTYGADVINGLKMLDPAAIIDNREAWVDRWNEKVVN